MSHDPAARRADLRLKMSALEHEINWRKVPAKPEVKKPPQHNKALAK